MYVKAVKISGRRTACKSPIGSGGQDVGHIGVVIGRDAVSLCSLHFLRTVPNGVCLESCLIDDKNVNHIHTWIVVV